MPISFALFWNTLYLIDQIFHVGLLRNGFYNPQLQNIILPFLETRQKQTVISQQLHEKFAEDFFF